MNNDDHESPDRNRQADEADLGPEPDWLTALDEPADDSAPKQPADEHSPSQETVEQPPEPEVNTRPDPATSPQPMVDYRASSEPIEGEVVAVSSTPAAPAVRKERPWLYWAVPMLLLVVTAAIAWYGSTQGFNSFRTWSRLRFDHAGLLPTRWAMLMWWIILPLLGVFLVYGAMPAGREIARIKRTGPLITVALGASILWIFAQHWRWEEVALISMVIGLATMLTAYLLVALNKHIAKRMQRIIAVVPLSAALGFTFMLLTISWQNYSTEPFGARWTSILLIFLLLVAATIFSFFMHDGVVALVFTIWFLGVAIQQWGNDAVISLSAIIAMILAAVIAGLGFIMSAESHRPSLTAQVSNRRGKVNFFRKSGESTSGELP